MPTVKEVLDYSQKVTKRKINLADIAKALNTSRSNITHKSKRETELKLSELRAIANYLNVDNKATYLNGLLNPNNSLEYISEDSMPVDDFVELDYYPSVFGSCGNGTFVLSEQKEKIKVPCQCLRNYSGFKNYSVINAKGDSMSPYILDKDRLIVEHYNGEQISDNKIYVFRYGENLFVKRLVLNIDQIVVKSDNKEYQSRNIEKQDMSEFQIIGKIVGIFREEC